MKYIIYISALIFTLSPQVNFAQGHTHDEVGHAAATPATGVFTIYAQSQKYELTMKHGRIEPGKESELTLYVADFKTNAPVTGAEIKVTVQEDPSLHVNVDAHEPGIYHVDVAFPNVQSYALTVNLSTPGLGADLLLLNPVEVGKSPPTSEVMASADSHDEHGQWWKYGLVLLGGLFLGWLLFRRQPRVAAVLMIALLIPAVVQEAGAHGDHDEEKAGTAGNTVFVPKETQFLFEVLTQPIAPGDFQPAIQLYGTVVPSPGGFAQITSPQNGRITSLPVTPGQRVAAGQVLAVLKPSSSQSDQVSVATETGRLETDIQSAMAERDAAEKEMRRLNAIADIAAKKDVQAAEAHYNAAEANLKSLRSVASGSVAAARSDVVLRSPVSGTVGQFTLAPGTEVQAGNSLFSVTSLEKVYIEAQVYDKDSEVVRNANKYSVTCSNDEHEAAQVRLVSAALEVNPTNQSQKVLFELQNPDGEFKIGEFVTLQAYQRMSSKTIFVPNSTLSEINGRSAVFVKDAPEMYSLRYVSFGEDNGANTVVLKGIKEDDRIVIAGTYQVKMMMLNQ
jgi:RND family efflux transporter MFP subunit